MILRFICLLVGHRPQTKFYLMAPGHEGHPGGYGTYVQCERCKERLLG